MNLSQIRDECWDTAGEVGDSDVDRFWPTSEMNRYINRIYRYIAKETKCIKDSTTPDVVLISYDTVDYTTYVAGTLDYIWANDSNNWLYQKDVAAYLHDLHASILDVDEVKMTYRDWKLRKVSSQKWQMNPRWEQTVGQPTEFALDLQSGKLALNFRDETSETLQMVVRRLPLTDLAADSDTPEFKADYHDYFKNGVLSMMYEKQDSETFDMAKSEDYWAKFLLDVDQIKQDETKLEEHMRPNSPMTAFM